MKISVSMSRDDVAYLDQMAAQRSDSRSAVVAAAIQALRTAQLSDQYETAWAEESPQDWDHTLKDGLSDEAW